MSGNNHPLPSSYAPRYTSLDLWRGLACLMVVVNHSSFRQPPPTADSPFGWGWAGHVLSEIALRLWIGVPIFFVISGYCIAATADAARRKGTGWRLFAARRIRRIFPPYLICLGVTAGLVVVAEVARPGSILATGEMFRPWWFSGSQWFGNITLTEIWRYHVFGGPKGLFLSHAWTLCYEEQFYAVMGLLLLVARRWLFWGVAAVTLGCWVTAFVCRLHGVPIDGFFFDGAWTLFACGVLVYYALNYASWAGRSIAAAVLAGAIVYSAWEPDLLLAPTKNSKQELFVATGFALVALLGRPADGWLTSRVWLRPLFTCGTMCYSLYLVHFPVTIFLNAIARQFGVDPTQLSPFITIPVGITVSVAVARVFFRVVERRFLNASDPRAEGGAPCSVVAPGLPKSDALVVPLAAPPDFSPVVAVTVPRQH